MTNVARMQNSQFHVTRIQRNVVARRERQFLTWMCAKLPQRAMPDHFTIVGAVGALLVFAAYIASRSNSAYLWLASLGLLIHWFGDSLDGSLARYRHIERPIYGYFLDHTVDAISNFVIMGGLGLTLYVRMDVSLFALIGYYLLCIYVFINNHLSGVLQLSFFGFGPTELRLVLVVINTVMFFVGGAGFRLGTQSFSIYDVVLFAAGSLFTVLFLMRMIVGIRELREMPRGTDRDGSQSASRNLSKASK